ncbi:hypothetical protein [Aeromonas caviae]|uniref:hypothetical protein n=1 Tax=Aeromonas caviae TaxID=648 RepID=UPI001F20DFD8|nr:hypothetical protein [Aeromonas caviae]
MATYFCDAIHFSTNKLAIAIYAVQSYLASQELMMLSRFLTARRIEQMNLDDESFGSFPV